MQNRGVFGGARFSIANEGFEKIEGFVKKMLYL